MSLLSHSHSKSPKWVQFLSLNPLGTAAFLRMRLRAHLNEIKADDIEISEEGIEELTDDELRQACRARGMAAPFGKGCTSFMQRQLREWIELSLDKCAFLHSSAPLVRVSQIVLWASVTDCTEGIQCWACSGCSEMRSPRIASELRRPSLACKRNCATAQPRQNWLVPGWV